MSVHPDAGVDRWVRAGWREWRFAGFQHGRRGELAHGDHVFIAEAVDFILIRPSGEIVGKLHGVTHSRRRAENVTFLNGGIRRGDVFQIPFRAEIPRDGGACNNQEE